MLVRTSKEIEQEFRADLAELLKKYNAELTVTDDHKPYGMHSGVCEIYIPAVFNGLGDVVKESSCFTL